MSRRILVLANRAADAEIHAVPLDRAGPRGLEHRAFPGLKLADKALGLLIGGDQDFPATCEPQFQVTSPRVRAISPSHAPPGRPPSGTRSLLARAFAGRTRCDPRVPKRAAGARGRSRCRR